MQDFHIGNFENSYLDEESSFYFLLLIPVRLPRSVIVTDTIITLFVVPFLRKFLLLKITTCVCANILLQQISWDSFVLDKRQEKKRGTSPRGQQLTALNSSLPSHPRTHFSLFSSIFLESFFSFRSPFLSYQIDMNFCLQTSLPNKCSRAKIKRPKYSSGSRKCRIKLGKIPKLRR